MECYIIRHMKHVRLSFALAVLLLGLILDFTLNPTFAPTVLPKITSAVFEHSNATTPLVLDEFFLPEPYSLENGVETMVYNDALKYCETNNSRLPSVKEVGEWASKHGALVTKVKSSVEFETIYLEKTPSNTEVDFYFDASKFVYPVERHITNAAIWTSDFRNLGGTLTHYAFSPYSAYFSPVPNSSMLGVICLPK